MNNFNTEVIFGGEKSLTINVVDNPFVDTKNYSGISGVRISYDTRPIYMIRPKPTSKFMDLVLYPDFFSERYCDKDGNLLEQRFYSTSGSDIVGPNKELFGRQNNLVLFVNDPQFDSKKSITVFDTSCNQIVYNSPDDAINVTLVRSKERNSIMVEDSQHITSTFSLGKNTKSNTQNVCTKILSTAQDLV